MLIFNTFIWFFYFLTNFFIKFVRHSSFFARFFGSEANKLINIHCQFRVFVPLLRKNLLGCMKKLDLCLLALLASNGHHQQRNLNSLVLVLSVFLNFMKLFSHIIWNHHISSAIIHFLPNINLTAAQSVLKEVKVHYIFWYVQIFWFASSLKRRNFTKKI